MIWRWLRALSLIPAFWLPGAAAAPEPIDLEQAIGLALRQNRGLQLTEMALASSQLGLQDARVDFAFTVTPAATASAADDINTVVGGLTAAKRTEFGAALSAGALYEQNSPSESADLHRGTVRCELSQPLLRRFGALVNREPIVNAESRVMAARREVELRRNDLVVQVVEQYEELHGLQRQRDFDEQALARLDKLQRLTRARERQGRASRVDVLRVELQYGEAQVRLNRSLEQIISRRAEFADLLGCPIEREFAPVTAPIVQVPVTNLAAATAVALSNRLDWAQVLQDEKDAERGIKIARNNLLPDLELIARYDRYSDGPGAGDALRFDEGAWFVGLNAQSDVLRRREHIALQQSVIDSERARKNAEIVASGIQRQVQQALTAYERARTDVALADRNHRLAQNRVLLARRMFETGRGDNFAVTDAENAYQQAQNQMLNAQADVAIAAYRLLRTLGILLEAPEELKPAAAARWK